MLNAILISHGKTGTLLYEKIFLKELNDENLEILNSFLTALKSFTSEILVDGSKEVKSVSIGDYRVKSTFIPEINSDLIMVLDKEDQKIKNKLAPPLIEIIKNHKDLFLETDYTPERFKTFDQQINNLILSSKKLIDEVILERKDDVFKSIWIQKGAISTKLRGSLIKEKEKILMKLKKEDNYPKRLILVERLINLLEKLNEEDEFTKFQKEAEAIGKEIRDIKVRLSFYLKLTKEALKYSEYNKAYSNLYSFSSKLKNMAKPQVQENYHMLATTLAKKDKIPKIEFSQAVSEILISPDNIDEYLP